MLKIIVSKKKEQNGEFSFIAKVDISWLPGVSGDTTRIISPKCKNPNEAITIVAADASFISHQLSELSEKVLRDITSGKMDEYCKKINVLL